MKMIRNSGSLPAMLSMLIARVREEVMSEEGAPEITPRLHSSRKRGKPTRSSRGRLKLLLRQKTCAAVHLGTTVAKLTDAQFKEYMKGRGRALPQLR